MIKCTFNKLTKLVSSTDEGGTIIQNYLSNAGIYKEHLPETGVGEPDWDYENCRMALLDDEYQNLVENQEVLGLFIVEE